MPDAPSQTANPILLPDPNLPQRSQDGTILEPSSQSTQKDTSSTNQLEPKPEPKTPEPAKKPDDASLLNKKPDTPQGAPEKYEDFKLPDGLTLEPTALAEATEVFKGLNLSQDQAQSLIDFHAKQLKSATDAPYTAVSELKNTWETQVRETYGKDIEPGGKVNVAIARAIDSLPPTIAKNFRAAMDQTLAGSHPAFVDAMYEISKRLTEGTPVKGNGPSPLGQKSPDAKPLSVAQAMYPHLPSANARQS